MPCYRWINKVSGEVRDNVYAEIVNIDAFLETVPDPENWEREIHLVGHIGPKRKGSW